MAEYEEKFTQLSKYAQKIVNTETKRKRDFQQGLTVEIQDVLVTANVETYAAVVKMAQKKEDSKQWLGNSKTSEDLTIRLG